MGVNSRVDVAVVDACPPGTYSTGSECVECPIDTYQHRDGAAACLLCPPGTYTSRRAARNVTECTGLTLININKYYLLIYYCYAALPL